MEFLSVYNYRLSYRGGRENANADFLSIPLPPTVEDISGSSVSTDPDDLGVYLIRACGYITSFCPIPGVGLGGIAPLPNSFPGTEPNGFAPLPTPVLGGLPLTKNDFWTHCAPIPTLHMTGPTTGPFAAPTEEQCLSYAINDQNDTSRFNCAIRTRSYAAILAGNTALCPDCRTTARSGFAASAAPAPPPKVQFRSSPPPRSAHLGSTIPLGRHASPRPTPAPNPQLDHSQLAAPPVLQTNAPDHERRR